MPKLQKLFSPFMSNSASKSETEQSWISEKVLNRLKSGAVSKVVTVSGPGIVRSAGIPTLNLYPSEDDYLIKSLLDNHFDLRQSRDLFNRKFFHKHPEPLWSLAKLSSGPKVRPTPSHWFVGYLNQRGILRRHYSVNVDSLDRRLGLKANQLIEINGSFDDAVCEECGLCYDHLWLQKVLHSSLVPRCEHCFSVVSPEVRMQGDRLPKRLFKFTNKDFSASDLVILIGVDGDTGNTEPLSSLKSRILSTGVTTLVLGSDSDDWANGKKNVFICSKSCDEATMELLDLLGWQEGFESFVNFFTKMRRF